MDRTGARESWRSVCMRVIGLCRDDKIDTRFWDYPEIVMYCDCDAWCVLVIRSDLTF